MDVIPNYLKPITQAETLTRHSHTQASYIAIQGMLSAMIGLVLFLLFLYLFV